MNQNNIDGEIVKSISDNIDTIINNIKKSPEFNLVKNNNLFKISRKINCLDQNDNNNFVCYESKMIPIDEYAKYLVFSLENFYARTENNLVKYIKDYDLDPTKYIYYDRLNKYKKISGGIDFKSALNCSIDVRIEYDEKLLKYTNDKNEFISFSYDYEYDEDYEDLDDQEKKDNIKKFIDFCDFLLKRIEKCGEFSTILLTNWTSAKSENTLKKYTSHRNIILVQNFKNEIVFNHYEPHGIDTSYYKDEREDFFDNLNDFFENSYQKHYLKESLKSKKKKPIFKKINISAFNASICLGIQKELEKYDIGYCSLFSFFWLYCLLTIFFELKSLFSKKNIEMFTINQLAPIFENILISKFKNDKQTLYNIIVAFSLKLFEEYLKSDLVSNVDKSVFYIIQNLLTNELWNRYPSSKVSFEKWNKNKQNNIQDTDNYFQNISTNQFKENLDSNLLDIENRNIKKTFPTLYKSCKQDYDCSNPELMCLFDEETDENICLHKSKKTLFSNCQSNNNCFSNNCVNNICKPKDTINTVQPLEIKFEDQPLEIKFEVQPLEIKFEDQPLEIKFEDQPLEIEFEDQPLEIKFEDQPLEIEYVNK
jgi:hypothetical protein